MFFFKLKKVACNSVYGIFGARFGALSLIALSRTTTALGRQMIQQTVDYCHDQAQEKYPTIKVIYGDSVTKNTLITLQMPEKTPCGNNSVVTKTIEEFWDIVEQKRQEAFEEFCPFDLITTATTIKPVIDIQNKETFFILDLGFKVWSDSGFTVVKSIIRHLPKKQKMYRIKTRRGIVEVTGDHSLLQRDAETKEIKCVKPCDLNVGDKIIHKNYE